MFHKLSKPPAFSRVKCHSDGNKLLGTYFGLPINLFYFVQRNAKDLPRVLWSVTRIFVEFVSDACSGK